MNDLPVAVLDQIVRQQAEIDRLKAELERVREKVLWPPNPQSWTVIRITELEKLERQLDASQALLAEARAENSHLWVRIESGEAAAYEQGKAEARQAAAREIIEQLDKQQPYHENATYLFIRDYIVKTFGLEG